MGRKARRNHRMVSFDANDAASALGVFRGPVGHFVHCSTILTYGPPFSGISLDETGRRIEGFWRKLSCL
jgi:hypothetical protein